MWVLGTVCSSCARTLRVINTELSLQAIKDIFHTHKRHSMSYATFIIKDINIVMGYIIIVTIITVIVL